jgi:hypothetical protein
MRPGKAAFAYGLGAVLGVIVILAFVEHGVTPFGWGLAVNGAVSLGVPLAVLVARGGAGRPGTEILRRLRDLVEGVSLPFALQGLYVIGYRFTSGLGTGKPTTFSYAYLIASLLVAVTATSIALVSSVPLTRGDLTPDRATRHVVAASWLSLERAGAARRRAGSSGRRWPAPPGPVGWPSRCWRRSRCRRRVRSATSWARSPGG